MSDSQMKNEEKQIDSSQAELDKIIEMGAAEKSAEEDRKLKAQAVTYVQYDELVDFEPDHQFHTD